MINGNNEYLCNPKNDDPELRSRAQVAWEDNFEEPWPGRCTATPVPDVSETPNTSYLVSPPSPSGTLGSVGDSQAQQEGVHNIPKIGPGN